MFLIILCRFILYKLLLWKTIADRSELKETDFSIATKHPPLFYNSEVVRHYKSLIVETPEDRFSHDMAQFIM